MEDEIEPDKGSTLRSYIDVLWRRKWIVLVPTILVPVIALVASKAQADVYQASADVLATRQELAATSIVGQTPAFDDINRTASTQASLAMTPTVAARALAAVGSRRDPQDFLNHSDVFPSDDLLVFEVRDSNPDTAVRLANAYAGAYTLYRRQLDTRALSQTLGELGRQIDDVVRSGGKDSRLYVSLVQRQQQLEALRTLRESNVFLVRRADHPAVTQLAPRPLRNTALGLVAGFVLGVILAYLWEALDTRVRTVRDVEAALGLPLLATLRDRDRRPRADTLPTLSDPASATAEAYHVLRLNLELANKDHAARALLVTSSRDGEGVARTAANLAIAFARAGRRVALVDLDFRSRSLTRIFGLEERHGVTDVSSGGARLDDAVARVSLTPSGEPREPASNGSGALGGLLEVLGCGSSPSQPTEYSGSRALELLLDQLRERADVVLAAGPSLLATGDATALGMRLESVLLVVAPKMVRRPLLAEARRRLDAWPSAKLGFALSAAPEDTGSEKSASPAVAGRSEEPSMREEAAWR